MTSYIIFVVGVGIIVALLKIAKAIKEVNSAPQEIMDKLKRLEEDIKSTVTPPAGAPK